MTQIEEILQDLRALKGPVVVLGHLHPDADCVGSALGVATLLRNFGIEAYGMTPEPAPNVMGWALEGTPWMEPSHSFLKGKTIVTVDAAARFLLEPIIGDYPVAVAIDHHISHEPFAAKTHVMEATSVSEIVARLFAKASLKAPIKIAEALYAGFLFDSGRWWWGGVGKGSFEMGLWMAECGVDFRDVTERLYSHESLGHMRLLQAVLSKMEFLADGAIVWVMLTEADFAAAKACRYDKEGIIDTLRMIEGVEIAVVLNQERGVIKGSLRARSGAARLDLFGGLYGGGGHKAAAGLGRGSSEPAETFIATFKERILKHWETVKADVARAH